MPVSVETPGARFRRLHEQDGIFVMPNVWDVATARIAAGLGFQALATSSGACAGVLGRRDGSVSRDEALSHAGVIVTASTLPVSADLERGFGDDPRAVAETIRLAAASGLAGASIEDATGDAGHPIYDLAHATERIHAAAEAARLAEGEFVLTARAENFLHERADLDDTIRRLQAFESAGADVLFAPGLPSLEAVQAVCSAISKPVSYMVGMPEMTLALADLRHAGVRRVSLATSLFRTAMTSVVSALQEVADTGTFSYVDKGRPTSALIELMDRA